MSELASEPEPAKATPEPEEAAGAAEEPGHDNAASAEPAAAGEAAPEEESTAEFTPVVQLNDVEVTSGEEGEEVVFGMRGKLYRFGETLLDKNTGKKTWSERGVGEFKVLRDSDSQRQRFLMRQEKTLKLILNAAADPRIMLIPSKSNDKCWVWSCFDFSEGELVEEVLQFKCPSVEDAAKFKAAFEQCLADMTKLLEGADGAENPEADEAAAALENLTTTEEGASGGSEEGK